MFLWNKIRSFWKLLVFFYVDFYVQWFDTLLVRNIFHVNLYWYFCLKISIQDQQKEARKHQTYYYNNNCFHNILSHSPQHFCGDSFHIWVWIDNICGSLLCLWITTSGVFINFWLLNNTRSLKFASVNSTFSPRTINFCLNSKPCVVYTQRKYLKYLSSSNLILWFLCLIICLYFA